MTNWKEFFEANSFFENIYLYKNNIYKRGRMKMKYWVHKAPKMVKIDDNEEIFDHFDDGPIWEDFDNLKDAKVRYDQMYLQYPGCRIYIYEEINGEKVLIK